MEIEKEKEFIDGLLKNVHDMEDPKEKIRAQLRLEQAMSVYDGEDQLISSLDWLEIIKNEPPQKKYLTGIVELDNILDGFRENQIIVLAAPTKSGKSQMTVELAIRMPHTNPVFFPFEETARELVQKFHDLGEEPPMFYSPKQMSGNTVGWLEKKIVEGMVKYDSKMFFIDHLHFIIPFSSDRQDVRIGQVMRDLKTIAKNYGVIIVLVAHLKKTQMQIAPTLEDLRDSSFIAQEADTVLMMWRESRREDGVMITTSNTILSVQANRRKGTTGNVPLVFRGNRFIEEDWRADSEEVSEAKFQGTYEAKSKYEL